MGIPPPNRIAFATDEEVVAAIQRLGHRRQSFTTVELIREILGEYFVDPNTPAGESANAQFGKRVAQRALDWGLVRVPPRESGTTDDDGRSTTTASWRLGG